jgi:hypothetical protein
VSVAVSARLRSQPRDVPGMSTRTIVRYVH